MNSFSCQWDRFLEEEVSSARPFEKEFVRKIFHLPIFIFPAIAFYSVASAVLALASLVVCYIAILVYEKLSNKKFPIISSIISLCKRDVDYDFGPLYLGIGMIIALCIASPRDVLYAAYVIAICDTAASLVGVRFGKNKIQLLNKSCIGSMAFFVTCFLGGLIYLSPTESLILATCLTFVELFSIKGLDNFTLPIFSQLLLLHI